MGKTFRFGIIAIFLAYAIRPGSSQDHAPTTDMCRADANLWTSEATDYFLAETDYTQKGLPNKTAVMQLSFHQVNERSYEMGQCLVVDPSSEDKYQSLLREYGELRDDRYKFFIERHNLKKQMLAEDAAGRRH